PLPSYSFYSYAHHPDLPSFPTRRSSDLVGHEGSGPYRRLVVGEREEGRPAADVPEPQDAVAGGQHAVAPLAAAAPGEDLLAVRRSEEHTSELQSRGHLVCRLLLEKKKQK